MSKRITPESSVKSAVCDLLDAYRILWFRNNCGRARLNGNVWVTFGMPGMADLLAFPKQRTIGGGWRPMPLWIELKAGKNGQSPEQKLFQKQVEEDGHFYLIVRDALELLDWLKRQGAI